MNNKQKGNLVSKYIIGKCVPIFLFVV